MKSLNTCESFLAISLLAAMLGFVVSPAAAAQDGSANNSQQAKSQTANSSQKIPASESKDIRARRAASSPAGQPVENEPAASTKSPDKNLVAENKNATDAEVLALRDEINAASDEQERVRLQLKLVEQLVAKGLKQEATAELRSMSGEDRFNPQGLYNIGNAQVRLGDTEGAVSSYRKAIEQRKGRYSRASNNLGVVLLRLGRWDESYDAFTSALRHESFRYAEASFNLGRLYAARGERDLAVREWRRAVAVDPEHAAAIRALANYGTAGNITVAARTPRPNLNKPAGGIGRSPEVDGSAAEKASPTIITKPATALAGGKRRSAPTLAPRAFTVDPETYGFLQRGRSARERGRNDEAVENYRRVINRMGGYFAPANLELGFALIALKRNDEAVVSLLAIAQKDGARFPISYYHLARLYELRSELSLAEDYYSRAAESHDDSNSQFLLDLSRVREKLGNTAGALASLEQYLAALERQGQIPEWSGERLAALKQRLAASTKP